MTILTSPKSRNMQRKFHQLDSALRTSFDNLKRDFLEQEKTIEELNTRITKQDRFLKQLHAKSAEHEKAIKHVSAEIADLKSEKSQVFGKRSVKSTERSVSVRRKPNTGLTSLHIEMLKRLMLLQMEGSKRGISMRELAAEVYPSKPYARIKSTLSEYVKKLHLAGLIEKHMNGRLFLSFTEKALAYADEQRLSRMKELISKPFGKSFGVR